MAETSWDDVGRQFAELGRKLQGTWEDARTSDAAADVKDAGDKVKAALDDVSATVQRVIESPDLHHAAKSTGASVADALASSLRQVADLISASAAKRSPAADSSDAPDSSDSPASSDNGTRELESSSDD